MLFRQEAIDHHRTTFCGDITLPVPPSLTASTLFLATCLAAAAAFLATGTYTRHAHAPGFLVPQHGVTRIMPPRAGTIASLYVHEGDLVRQGDKLLTVSTDPADANGRTVSSAVLETLRQQASQLRAQIALETSRAQTQKTAAEAAIEGLKQQITSLQAERALQLQRAGIALRDLQALAGLLARGEISAVEGRRRQDAYLLQRQAESASARAVLDKQAELARLRSQEADISPASAERLAVLRGSAADIDARIAELDGQRAYLLTAPVSGRISTLQAFAGKSVDPTQPQMAIVPDEDVLLAQVLVPAHAIGLLKAGQAVRLSYDPFPTATFGFAEGRVETISRTLLKQAEAAGPGQPDAPSFRITVRLARQTIGEAGHKIALQPDIPLQADIALETRSLLAWVLSPLSHGDWP